MYQPSTIESDNVLDVYSTIYKNFSDTRFNTWPGLEGFIDRLPETSTGFEIGFGNGKNMRYAINKGHTISGIDTCPEFVHMCKTDHNLDVYQGNCVNQTFVDEQFDFAISIAVFHHLSSKESRNKSLDNMINILKSGGKGFVTVWAIEQPENSKKKFTEGDNMVKWSKPIYIDTVRHYEVLERYYYVFSEKLFREYIGSFKERIDIINITNEYGNWTCEFQKIK